MTAPQDPAAASPAQPVRPRPLTRAATPQTTNGTASPPARYRLRESGPLPRLPRTGGAFNADRLGPGKCKRHGAHDMPGLAGAAAPESAAENIVREISNQPGNLLRWHATSAG